MALPFDVMSVFAPLAAAPRLARDAAAVVAPVPPSPTPSVGLAAMAGANASVATTNVAANGHLLRESDIAGLVDKEIPGGGGARALLRVGQCAQQRGDQRDELRRRQRRDVGRQRRRGEH